MLRNTIESVSAWRQSLHLQSLQLDELLAGDFSSLRAEIAVAFPQTGDRMAVAPVDIVRLFADQIGGRYSRPLSRMFSGLSGDDATTLSDVYRSAQIDAALIEAERKALVQQRVILVPFAAPPPRFVRWRVFSPWQCEVDVDPLNADDLSVARELRVAVPVAANDTSITYADAHITRTEAWIADGGKKRPLFGSSSAHPWPGMLPALEATVPQAYPLPGRFFPSVDEALLKLCIALCLDESDIRLIAHHQAWGQRWIGGVDNKLMVDWLTEGPDTWLFLPQSMSGTGSATAGIVQASPPLAELSNWQEARIRKFAAIRGLAADSLLKHNTSATQSAREMTRIELAAKRSIYDPLWRSVEDGIAAWTVRLVNLARPLVTLPAPTSTVIFWAQGDTWGSSLERAQARGLEVEQGMTTIARELSHAEGIPLAVAEVRVQANLDATAALRDTEEPDVPDAPSDTPADAPAPPAPATTPDAPTGAPSAAVVTEALALNGAQVVAAQGIVQSVAEGKMPRESGIQMLIAFFAIKPDVAEAIMGEVGKSFFIVAPLPPLVP